MDLPPVCGSWNSEMKLLNEFDVYEENSKEENISNVNKKHKSDNNLPHEVEKK